MKTRIWILAILLVVLTGCTSFKGLKPIYPEVDNPNFPKAVESLQPTFQWEPSQEPDVAYDFVVYEGIKGEDFFTGTTRAVGREVYYREGLAETKHTIEEPLKPDTEYYWSVRTRRGQMVSSWSLYDYTLFLGTGYMRATNHPFIFKTPKK